MATNPNIFTICLDESEFTELTNDLIASNGKHNKFALMFKSMMTERARLGGTYRKRLELFIEESGTKGATADELMRTVGASHASIAGSLAELKEMGFFIPLSLKRRTKLGAWATVHIHHTHYKEYLNDCEADKNNCRTGKATTKKANAK